MKPKTWYRDAPTLISLLAVVFSLTTAFASYRQVEIQSKREARGELRGLIQRLTSMPLEQAEIYRTYKDDISTLGNLSSSWNSEYVLLASQAAELAERIPKDISAPEYYAISQALINQGITETVPQLLEAGIKVSKDINSHIALVRSKAAYGFQTGELDEGRAAYQEAIALVETYSANQYAAQYFNAYTKMLWAGSEYSSGQCENAAILSEEASADIAEMLPSVDRDNLSRQLATAQQYREANQQVCQ